MSREPEHTETETHHNQALTEGARAKLARPKSSKRSRKTVVLQLDEKEATALQYLGGNAELKNLLCPEGLCICCRNAPSVEGTLFESLCKNCASKEN